MRLGTFLSIAVALMLSLWSTPSLAASTSHVGTTVVALQQQPSGGAAEPAQPSSGAAQQAQPTGKVDVDIDLHSGNGGGRWYANPMWIAIGALAVIVLIALIVMAGRGGGTTVIRG